MFGSGQVDASALCMVNDPPGIGVYDAPAGITVCGVYWPVASAAAESITFIVEPGEKVSWVALFSSGLSGSALSCSYALPAAFVSWLTSGVGL